MDTEAALREIESFTTDISELKGVLASMGAKRDREELRTLVMQALPGMRRIAAAVSPRYRSFFFEGPESFGSSLLNRWFDEANQVAGSLISGPLIDEIVGPTGPDLRASELHPWIWEAAEGAWNSCLYRLAVQTAAEAVLRKVRDELGRPDLTGAQIVREAFSAAPASVNAPRLRSKVFDNADPVAFKDAHTGALEYGVGCVSLIRNLSTHASDDDWSSNVGANAETVEHIALEHLAALSVLARVVEAYDVVVE